MATATDREQFDAAVKIITSLPKDGPFQPSNDMKLKFYGLYKQATIGPCTSPQPGFWDVVNKAKWNAWKALGDLSKEDAMRNYVENIKQVVETMTLDANVQDFLEKMGPIYEFVTDDGRVVSKRADINHMQPNSAALALLDFAKGGHMVNGNKASAKKKTVNGNLSNGVADGPDHDSESDDAKENRNRPRIDNKSVGNAAVARKSDLEVGSDEEEFDDASDNQAFAAVTVDMPPIQSSGSHSPISHDSTPRRVSRAVQSSDELRGNQPKITRPNFSVSASVDMDQVKSLSSSRRRAAAALGQLLRLLPELESNNNKVPSDASAGTVVVRSSSEDSVIRAWAILRRVQAEHVRQTQDDDDWIIRRLKHLKRAKSGHRKHRGRGGNGERQRDNTNAPMDAELAGASFQPVDSNGAGEASTSRRNQRQLSGESGSSSSSSGSDSISLDLDPHIGAVLLRMHRELQHVSRQLELVEGILITQQHMIRDIIAASIQSKEKKMRLGFFSNLPWRTIAFILAWPVIVNILVRLWIFRMKRRR